MCARKLRLALFQYNPGFHGDSAYLPYSAGMLWAYARSFPEIREAAQLADGTSTRFSAVVRSVDLSVPTRAALEIIAS